MKFLVLKASDDEFKEEVEISSLEEFISFQEKCNHEVIFGKNEYEEISDADYVLTIYDDYVE